MLRIINYFLSIYIMACISQFMTIGNNGTDNVDGYSNQCMLISILDHLRNTRALHEHPKLENIKSFRNFLGLDSRHWPENVEYDYEGANNEGPIANKQNEIMKNIMLIMKIAII